MTRAKKVLLAALGAAMVAAPGFWIASGVAGQSAAVQPGREDLELTARSLPSEEVELRAIYQMPISKVMVSRGDRVRKGDVLVVQDDRIDMIRVDQLKAEIRGAEARVNYTKQSRPKLQKRFDDKMALFNQGVKDGVKLLSQDEVISAELELLRAIAEGEENAAVAAQKTAELRQQEVRLDQLRLKASVDGYVRMLEAKEGAMPDGQKPSVVLVKVDPLYVEFNVPAARTLLMKLGDEFEATYEVDRSIVVRGKVTFIDPVADEASGTRRVRMTVANPEMRPAGLRLRVKVPAAAPATKPAENAGQVRSGTNQG